MNIFQRHQHLPNVNPLRLLPRLLGSNALEIMDLWAWILHTAVTMSYI